MSFVCVRIPAELDDRAKLLVHEHLRDKKSASRRAEWIIEKWVGEQVERRAKRRAKK